MRISDLHVDESLRLRAFPVAREKIYFAHGGDCPLPRCVADAVSNYAAKATLDDQEGVVYPAILDETRGVAATLLGCQADEVALVGPTSLALSFFASGLRFRKGDNILIYFEDYPSNVYPWMALAEQGVEVRLMNTRGLGVIRSQDVLGQVDENTRLVALASAHFISGYRIDYDAIGKELRKRNILFCLDAIQTLGAFPMKTENVDMLAADAHKWLLGPCGSGLMYVRKSIQDRLNPPVYGWNNVSCPNFVAQEDLKWKPGAHKYEAGTYNLLGLVGLLSSMRLLLDVGVENIASELLRKRKWLVAELQKRGWNVLGADWADQNTSGLTSFNRADVNMETLHRKLSDNKIVTSLRTDRAGRQYIRLSPHFYNTNAELQRFMDTL